MGRLRILIPSIAVLAATSVLGSTAMAGGYSGRSDWKENVLSLRAWPDPGQETGQDMARQIRWAGPGATSSNAVWATPSDVVRATPSGTIRMIPSDGTRVARSGVGQETPSDTRRAGPSDMGLATRSDADQAGGEDGADGI